MKQQIIVFEGIDGSGKTTQARLLKCHFENNGLRVLLTREPGGSELGERVRSLILNASLPKKSHFTNLFLFMVARAEHCALLANVRAQYDVIILDRFFYSTLCYQAVEGLPEHYLRSMNKKLISHYKLYPTQVFVIDTDPATSIGREQNLGLFYKKKDKGGIHKSNLRKLQAVRARFKKITPLFNETISQINGNRPSEVVYQSIIRVVQKKIRGDRGS